MNERTCFLFKGGVIFTMVSIFLFTGWIFLQISYYNYDRDEYRKNKIKNSLPAQYSMSFPGIESEVLYIIVSVYLHIGKDMDKGHYVCDVLY